MPLQTPKSQFLDHLYTLEVQFSDYVDIFEIPLPCHHDLTYLKNQQKNNEETARQRRKQLEKEKMAEDQEAKDREEERKRIAKQKEEEFDQQNLGEELEQEIVKMHEEDDEKHRQIRVMEMNRQKAAPPDSDAADEIIKNQVKNVQMVRNKCKESSHKY